jgi:hypothetical protein
MTMMMLKLWSLPVLDSWILLFKDIIKEMSMNYIE